MSYRLLTGPSLLSITCMQAVKCIRSLMRSGISLLSGKLRISCSSFEMFHAIADIKKRAKLSEGSKTKKGRLQACLQSSVSVLAVLLLRSEDNNVEDPLLEVAEALCLPREPEAHRSG